MGCSATRAVHRQPINERSHADFRGSAEAHGEPVLGRRLGRGQSAPTSAEAVAKLLTIPTHGARQNIHCIGDRANKAVLDIFESLLQGNTSTARARRPRIEHAQIMRREDLQRAGRLGGALSTPPPADTSHCARLIYWHTLPRSDHECATDTCVSPVSSVWLRRACRWRLTVHNLSRRRTSDMWYAEARLVRPPASSSPAQAGCD